MTVIALRISADMPESNDLMDFICAICVDFVWGGFEAFCGLFVGRGANLDASESHVKRWFPNVHTEPPSIAQELGAEGGTLSSVSLSSFDSRPSAASLVSFGQCDEAVAY